MMGYSDVRYCFAMAILVIIIFLLLSFFLWHMNLSTADLRNYWTEFHETWWSYRYIESNTGESTRQGNLRHPRVRFQSFSLRGLPSQRTIVILPKGDGDFLILYFFRCLILFLTKHLIVFVYIPSSVFPQFIFPLLK